MLDHVTIAVSDLRRAAAFYDAALAPLGIAARHEEAGRFIGYGADAPDFWIGRSEDAVGPVHVAFVAADRDAVACFHAAALAAGGRDNGAPGPRPRYGSAYFAAFVLDPDGHNIEAVCRRPP